MYCLLYVYRHNRKFYYKDFFHFFAIILVNSHLAPWEVPRVHIIIVEGSNRDNSAQVSPWAPAMTRRNEKGNQKNGAGGSLAEVMQDIQTLSAMAETEVAFKDYRSLA